jgi:hypothetical protein
LFSIDTPEGHLHDLTISFPNHAMKNDALDPKEGERMNSQLAEKSVTAAELDALRREVEALQGALGTARLVRLGIMGLAIVLVLVISWGTLTRVRDFVGEKNVEALTAAASARLDKNSDYYMRHFEQLTEKVGPVLTEAFFERAKQDMPRYLKAVEQEKKPLLENLESEFTKRLERRYEALRPELEAALVKELPKLKDAKLHDQVVANVDRAMRRVRQKYYIDDFRNEINGMYSTWDSFPAAPAPGTNDPSTEDQFVSALLDLLTYKLMHAQRFKAQP